MANETGQNPTPVSIVEGEDPRWQKLRDLLGLDGWVDGQFHGAANPDQIINHVEYVAHERARLLRANHIPERILSGDETAILYSEPTIEGSVIRLSKWPEGYVLWHDGEIAWRSWRKESQHVTLSISVDTQELQAAVAAGGNANG